MIDINYIRQNPEKVKLAVVQKQMSVEIDRLIYLDVEIRKLHHMIDSLRSQRNTLSNLVKTAHPEEKIKLIDNVKSIKDELSPLETKITDLKTEFNLLMLTVPSIPDPEVIKR